MTEAEADTTRLVQNAMYEAMRCHTFSPVTAMSSMIWVNKTCLLCLSGLNTYECGGAAGNRDYNPRMTLRMGETRM